MDLTQKHCVPCEGGMPPLPQEQEDELHKQVSDWLLLRDEGTTTVHKLRKLFKFDSFLQAVAFVDKIAPVAESEKHHPDIYIFYNKVQLDLYTHAVGGLSENDFIMAAKINNLKAN
ncbi:MAG: 4a-hydroxytetrahydrobiopterin dehydratase [Patescibacteria group bacterium]|nr:4a-hydroxytetrahydrobiopterin dehydratase [Patescibacteria group bacterium]MDE2589235.1 4a-hydroxytetrahydrobiopterin dehydratase [Patescibacteria group bacterium]